MSLDASPNYRVNVYGSDPTVQQFLDEMSYGGPRGSGGGLPWPRSGPSPTYPQSQGVSINLPQQTTTQQEPYRPSRVTEAGQVISGAAGGAANERDRRMNATNQRNANKLNIWTAEQQAMMDALVAAARDRMQGYQTKQGATTSAMSGLQTATSGALANQSNEGIARARLGLDAGDIRARQSVLGSLMKNLQPTSFQSAPGQQGHLTKVSGGLSPSALDPMTREHGAALLKAALEAQLTGSDVPGATDFMGGVQDWKSTILDVPEATDYTKSIKAAPQLEENYVKPGFWESVLSAIGTGAGIAGAFTGKR